MTTKLAFSGVNTKSGWDYTPKFPKFLNLNKMLNINKILSLNAVFSILYTARCFSERPLRRDHIVVAIDCLVFFKLIDEQNMCIPEYERNNFAS